MRAWALVAGLLAACTANAATKAVAVDIDGVVHPVTAEMVRSAIDLSKREHASLLLVRLNTPGGLMDAMREVVEAIVTSPVPVVTYVTPSGGRAASAGFFILESGDIAAMAPGTNTGAATPVLLGQQMDQVMRHKVENDAAAFIRSIATKRGRNSTLAEKAIYESRSFTDREALDDHLIDLVATDETQLFAKLDGREITRFDGRKETLHLGQVSVVEYQPNWRQRIVNAVADPNIALVLIVIGALGIYVEFSAPGLIVPGIAGAILVLLGLSGLSVLPINWAGVALLVLALTLFVLEAKFGTHGILAVGGTVSMIFGALLLVSSPLPEMRVRTSTAVGVALPFAIITSFLVTLAVRARANKVATGVQGMIQEVGVAYTPLAPAGKVFVHGEYWNAVSEAPVPAGARVRVTGVDGLTLRVEPALEKNGG